MNHQLVRGYAESPGLNLGETRASDTDRDRVARHLDAQHSAGRLSVQEHEARVTAAMAATTLPQLSQLYSDLPAIVMPGAKTRKSLIKRNAYTLRLLALSALGGIAVMIIPGSVLITGHQAHTPWWVVAGGWLSVCVGLIWTIVNIFWVVAMFDDV